MEDSKRIRRAAVAALVAGICTGLVLALQEVFEWIWFLTAIAVILIALLAWDLRTVMGGKARSAGSISAWLITIGSVLVAVLSVVGMVTELSGRDPDSVFPSWLQWGFPVGALMLAVGLVIFGIAAMASGLPKIPFLLILLFLPVGLGIDAATGALNSDEGGIGFYIGFGMLTAGLLWLGWDLRSRSAAGAQH